MAETIPNAGEASLCLDFAEQRFQEWTQRQVIRQDQLEAVIAFYARQRQRLAKAMQDGLPVPDDLRPPTLYASASADPDVAALRFLAALGRDVRKLANEGLLGLAQSHACLGGVRERSEALKRRLAQQGVPEEPAPPPVAATLADEPKKPFVVVASRRSLFQILLDPRSLQYLMILGGALLVLGLVIWLWAVGIFENKLVVASVMGLGTAALLAGGWAMIRFTRYQIAGQAITLLACLVMPLNLWFYHAQDLVKLEGHLWLAALVCCALYAASALILQQAMFVYVLVAGVTLTGLLILADENVRKLWEIAAPSTLLVVIGMLALHAERAFPAEGPFARQRFGMAFFWSGLTVLSSGLLLLLGAQLAGVPFVHGWGLEVIPEIANPKSTDLKTLQALALILVLAGTYAYVYSDLVVRRAGAFLYLAVFTLLWAEVLTIELLRWELKEEIAIIALAVTALAINLVQPLAGRREEAEASDTQAGAAQHLTASLARAGLPMGVFLCTLPVLLGLELHLRATYEVEQALQYKIGSLFVVAMLVAAASSRIGAHVYRNSKPMISETYFFATAAATLLAARGLLFLLGLKSTDALAPWLMLIPIAYVIAAQLYSGHTAQQPLRHVAQIATGLLIVAVLVAAFQLGPSQVVVAVWGADTNLRLAWFFAEAAVFYALAAAFVRRGFNVYLATAAASAAVWQLLNYWTVPEEYYTFTFALVGLLLLVGYRFAVAERFNIAGLAQAAFQCGNALLSLSFVAAALLVLSRLLTKDSVQATLLWLLLLLIVIGLLAAWLVRLGAWRRWYVATAVGNGCLAFVVINVLSDLSFWQKAEVFSVIVGLLLLVLGHIGWYKERGEERCEDWVSLTLLWGTLFAAVPINLAVLIQRSCGALNWHTFEMLNELGMLFIGLLMLGSGLVLKLRATTMAGALTMVVYLLSLLLFVHLPKELQTVAVYMMIGGGVFFATAVLLSIYRDRLMALPSEIKRHEGIFRVLTWR